MSDETTTTTEGTQPEVFTPEQVKERVESAKRGLIEQATTLQSELETLRAEKEARERQELEEAGKLQELVEKERKAAEAAKAELEQLRNTYETDRMKTNLDRALEREGVANQYTRTGIIGEYLAMDEKPEVDEFLGSLREKTPDIFGPAHTAGTKNKAVGSVVQRGQIDDAKADEMLKSSDPEVRKQGKEYYRGKYGLSTA